VSLGTSSEGQRLVMRVVVMVLVLGILALVISPDYDLPNSILHTKSSCLGIALLNAPTVTTLAAAQPTFLRTSTSHRGPTSIRLVELICVWLC
jgi:hypothetical protein